MRERELVTPAVLMAAEALVVKAMDSACRHFADAEAVANPGGHSRVPLSRAAAHPAAAAVTLRRVEVRELEPLGQVGRPFRLDAGIERLA
jgi:hypothetical protein